MSRKLYALLTVLVIGSMLLVACGGSATEAPADTSSEEGSMDEGSMDEETTEEEAPMVDFLACEVTDTGGIDDASFNQTAWNGVLQAEENLGVQGTYIESQEQADYEVNINAMIEQGCDLIITVGFLLGDATAAAAEANPDQEFGIIDYAYDPAYDNVAGHVFATDQAAFLAGYIAAANTQTGIVGTFGGINIPPVTVFMDGFWYGVQYYNNEMGADVQVLGWDPAAQDGLFTGNFDSLDDGRAMAESLMDEGADIVMPVAGPVGLGSAAAIQERGNAWLIGVDNDWTQTAPEYADIVLTSVLKNMDATVYSNIETLLNGGDPGALIVGNLENGGVGIAGDFSSMNLQPLIDGIIAGDIQTAP